MVKPNLPTRSFNRTDAGRSAIFLVLLAAVFAVWFFLLPWIQAVILPTATGGTSGPWVVRPIIAVRFCACAILAAASMPLLLWRFGKRWHAQDVAAGTRYDVRPGHKASVLIKGSILGLIYAGALLLYLFSWTIVGPSGIEQRMPWSHKEHSFDQIASLEMIPDGMRSDELVKNGPWFNVVFTDGRSFAFGHDNEGCAVTDMSAIATYIAEQSGQSWRVRVDARPR